nr:MAG TPA: hypothetical protein [Caudoviricetes sp.]
MTTDKITSWLLYSFRDIGRTKIYGCAFPAVRGVLR